MTKTSPITLVTLALISSAACKGDKTSEAAPAKAAAIDVAAINAGVPAELAEAIRFTQVDQDRGRIQVAAPDGWESEHMPGRYQPPRDANLGFFTGFGVGSNCDGTCSAKDWKATADKVEFAQFTGGDFEVVADTAIEGGRFLEANKDKTVYLRFAWWNKDSSRYFYCRATLEDAAIGARPAFEQACRSMAIAKWD